MASARYSQSSARRAPVRKAWLSMPASAERMRLVSCSLVISRLKMATGTFCCMATRVAMFSAKLVLPIPGRAARMMRSPRPRPVSTVSSRRKPVGMPLYLSASGPLIFCRLVRVSTMLEESGVSALESRPERIS